MLDNKGIVLVQQIAMASNYYSISIKQYEFEIVIINGQDKLKKKLDDGDKTKQLNKKLHRKRTEVLNNYTGEILILNLYILDSS